MKHSAIYIFLLLIFVFTTPIFVYAAPLSETTGTININSITGDVNLTGGVTTTTTTTSAPPTTTGGTGGTAGGGAAATTTTTTAAVTATTTTTIAPPVVESETVQTVAAGEAAVFKYEKVTLGVSEIIITTKSGTAAASNVQIEITKTTTIPATISIAAPDSIYAYLDITVKNVATTDIESAKIKFHVEKSWIDANGIDVATITLNRYVNGAWVTLTTTLTSSDGTSYYFEATSPGLSIFAITAKKTAATTTTTAIIPPITPDMTGWIIVIIVALVVIVLLIYFLRKKSLKKVLQQTLPI